MFALPRCLVGAVIPLAAVTASLSAQDPSKPKLPVTPGHSLNPSATGILTVDPPAVLTRDDLARRLKKLDGTLPDALPVEASVVLTPDRLRVGRAQLEIHGSQHVGFDSRGRPLAVYQEDRPVGFSLTFDVAGPSRFALDCSLLSTTRSSVGTIGGTFIITVSDGAREASVAPTPDGHLLHIFDAPRAGRYVVKVFRGPGPLHVVGSDSQWRLYRVELLRVR